MMDFRNTRFIRFVSSVGAKLFTVIFLSILGCVMTVGLMAYETSKEIIESKVSNASLQTVTQVANNLDIVYRTYEDLSLKLMFDADFHELVRKLLADDPELTKSQYAGKLADRVKGYVAGNVTINGILMIPVDPKLPVLEVGAAQSERAELLREADWYRTVVEQDGLALWIPPQADGLVAVPAPRNIGLSRLIKDSMTNQPSYVFLMEIHTASLVQRFEDVELGQGSELGIVDAQGNVIASTDSGRVGMPSGIAIPAGEGEAARRGTLKATLSGREQVLAAHSAFERMNWRLLATVPVDELVRNAKAIRTLTWIAAGVAAALAAAIGGLAVLTVAKPLVALRNLMREGASGNVTVRSDVRRRRDEIGQLSEGFNRMMDKIMELAAQTTRSAEDVLATAVDLTEASRKTAASAKEVAKATEEIATGAVSLAVEAERGTDLMREIDARMKDAVDANDRMVRSAREVERASERGIAYMDALTEKNRATEESARRTARRVDALGESAVSIAGVVDVLQRLTKQTNILSLNAAIEAARAGAAGQGFMVVAGEIRKLAEQSRQSIDIVGSIIGTIRSEIEETVQALSNNQRQVQSQSDAVREANDIFLAVKEEMRHFTETLALATEAIRGLDRSQSETAAAMASVSAVAEEASAASEQVASLSAEQLDVGDGMVRLSEKLDAVSRELKESVSKFKVE